MTSYKYDQQSNSKAWPRGEADAVAEIATRNHHCELVDLGNGRMALAKREDVEILSVKDLLDEYLEKPDRKRGTATLTELASFTQHVNRHKLANSVVFLDRGGPRLIAVYDYNNPANGDAQFGEHRAEYPFPLSDEWKAWTNVSGNLLSQSDFAHFLEDHLVDVVDSNTLKRREDVEALEEATGGRVALPRELLELSRGLKVKANRAYKSHQVLSSGETQFTFEESHEAANGGPLSLPTCFVISIPIFRAGAIYSIAVKLRYRLREGVVMWGFTLYKPEKRIDDALAESAELVRKETELPVFYGTPET